MTSAYREPDRVKGRQVMATLIDHISHGVPIVLNEVIMLGRTLKKGAEDVLAYFDRPSTSNGRPKPSTAASRTYGPRVPQPHRVHRQELAQVRWVQTRLHPGL